MSSPEYKRKQAQIQMMLEEIVEEVESRRQVIKRRRQVGIVELVLTLVLGWLEFPRGSLNQLRQVAERFGVTISCPGLTYRLTEEMSGLLSEVLAVSLSRLPGGDGLSLPHLPPLTGLYIIDSTQIGLPAEMNRLFAGNQDNAMMKLQVSLNYLTGQVSGLEMVDGKSPDQRCRLPVEQAQAGSLSIFDLGYFKQEHLHAIDEHGAYFLTRLQSQTALYDPQTGQRIKLRAWVGQQPTAGGERVCWLGARTQLPVRIVARPVDPAIAEQRRRHIRQKAKKQGKTCSADALFLQDYDLLVTNLPPEWTTPTLFTLYALRWQIELLFKSWKSQLHMADIGNWRPQRVLCQLYAQLIGVLLLQLLTADCRWLKGRELSFPRAIQVIQRFLPDICHCWNQHWRGWKALWTRLTDAFSRFALMESRKKTPSTRSQLILEGLT